MTFSNFWSAALVGTVCSVIISLPAAAQTESDRDHEIQDIRAQMQALEKRLDALQSTPANNAPPVVAAKNATMDEPSSPQIASPPINTFAKRSAKCDAVASGGTALPFDCIASQPPAPSGKALGSATSAFSIQGSSSGGNATVTIGNYPKILPITKSGWLNADTEEITMSAPLAKGGGTTSITALDSLASGGEIKFKWTRYARRVGTGFLSPSLQSKLQAAIDDCNADPTHKIAAVDCSKPEKRQAILEQYDPGDFAEFRKTVDPSPFGYAFGLSGGVGYTDFTYINTASITSVTIGKVSWEASPFISILANRGAPSSITLSYAYQHAFQDAKSGALCRVIVSSGASYNNCPSGPIGLPVSNNKSLIGLDYRVYLPKLPIIGRAAVSPQITYDFIKHYKAIDFPIYIVPDSNGKLIGGLDLGYSTQKRDFVLGVFIGAPFTIFH